jgi:S-adenosylmethionine:tRNA ribosyltransferase-isomerase
VNLSEYDYSLPKEKIAQTPVEPRDHSRMMVIGRKACTVEHRYFYDSIDYILPSDLLVLNNTRVIPARLNGERENGGKTEVFLLKNLSLSENGESFWNVLVKPGKRVKKGTKVFFDSGTLVGECIEHRSDGSRDFRFSNNPLVRTGQTREQVPQAVHSHLLRIGEVPLPPYIHENLADRERYQTIYSKIEGAVAAPTAGLHFTPGLIEEIRKQGTEFCEVTLHVGIGTFRPLEETDSPFSIEEHVMHAEFFRVEAAEMAKIERAKRQGRRIVAVGTTSVRVLESLPFFDKQEDGSCEGETRLFIYPPFTFKYTDVMITNFHLPRSSLLLLVSAFAGRDLILAAYEEAVETGYRFFSFGDACLIL